jgi:hypothetical protein
MEQNTQNMYNKNINITIIIHKCNEGESNGNLLLRTCPGCSVPEPYRSPDWALVLAKLA